MDSVITTPSQPCKELDIVEINTFITNSTFKILLYNPNK
ncbi:hypothetical protein PMIN01_09680 [Paraphaeosphaeria minitans]|uniref:Uncharacterized protein n=1 Tax=Paraphaeosphaeria minitans TaxID=565426 RepID=A0A9P6GC45_9PLEO|nr:hypothetical protein PMIN01_09680 [Paraphaeosphaeria minitans]